MKHFALNVFWDSWWSSLLWKAFETINEALCLKRFLRLSVNHILLKLSMKFFFGFERLLDSRWSNLIWTTFETRWSTWDSMKHKLFFLLWTSFKTLNEVSCFKCSLGHSVRLHALNVYFNWGSLLWTSLGTFNKAPCFKCHWDIQCNTLL